jgi:iron uptake system component EfeO
MTNERRHAQRFACAAFAALCLGLASCGGTDPEEEALLAVKDYVDVELEALRAAAVDLQAAAPLPDADGWNATDDADAVEAMRAAWRRARVAYEHIEGAIAILFPHLDRSTDERYDGFIEEDADPNLFDGSGVTGVHAIERILWADAHPAHVVEFEMALLNYSPAAFPANEAEATTFRDELVQKLIEDVTRMRDDFAPLALDPAAAYRGVIGSMEEQQEKVSLAATGEDESRYASYTLGDMRANLEGGRAIYGAFQPWLRGETDGEEIDGRIVAGFDRLSAAYGAISGDAIPEVPATWSATAPTEADLATPYGQLFTLVTHEGDPVVPTSLVSAMNDGGEALGIPQVP